MATLKKFQKFLKKRLAFFGNLCYYVLAFVKNNINEF